MGVGGQRSEAHPRPAPPGGEGCAKGREGAGGRVGRDRAGELGSGGEGLEMEPWVEWGGVRTGALGRVGKGQPEPCSYSTPPVHTAPAVTQG